MNNKVSVRSKKPPWKRGKLFAFKIKIFYYDKTNMSYAFEKIHSNELNAKLKEFIL